MSKRFTQFVNTVTQRITEDLHNVMGQGLAGYPQNAQPTMNRAQTETNRYRQKIQTGSHNGNVHQTGKVRYHTCPKISRILTYQGKDWPWGDLVCLRQGRRTPKTNPVNTSTKCFSSKQQLCRTRTDTNERKATEYPTPPPPNHFEKQATLIPNAPNTIDERDKELKCQRQRLDENPTAIANYTESMNEWWHGTKNGKLGNAQQTYAVLHRGPSSPNEHVYIRNAFGYKLNM